MLTFSKRGTVNLGLTIFFLLVIFAVNVLGPHMAWGRAEGGPERVPTVAHDVEKEGRIASEQFGVFAGKLYKWFLGIAGISALFGLVMGGTIYMFAGASLTKVEDAKKWITNALYGLILAGMSYILLQIINPQLVGGAVYEYKINFLPPASAPTTDSAPPPGSEPTPEPEPPHFF